MVESLAHQLQVVANNVVMLVRQAGRRQEESPQDSQSRTNNPLFEETGIIQLRSVRLDFPKFDGEDPNGLLYHANQFLCFHQTNAHCCILLAPFHME